MKAVCPFKASILFLVVAVRAELMHNMERGIYCGIYVFELKGLFTADEPTLPSLSCSLNKVHSDVGDD
jgi:hypothetical protein